MYSFENYPQTNSTELKLTPRSNEALKRTGFALEDLRTKSIE
jgi:hypothetical protein